MADVNYSSFGAQKRDESFTAIIINERGKTAPFEWQVIQGSTGGISAIEVRRPGGDKTTIRSSPDERSMEVVATHSEKGKGLTAGEAIFVAQSVLLSKEARDEVRSSAGDFMVNLMDRFGRLLERKLPGGVVPRELGSDQPAAGPGLCEQAEKNGQIIVRPGLCGHIGSSRPKSP